MARILGDLVVKNIGAGLWEVVEDIEFHVGQENSEEVIIVKKGLITDFASMPFGVRNILPKDGAWTRGSLFHDELYKYRGVLPVDCFRGPEKIYSQKDCDQIFDEINKITGVSWWQRFLIYNALRMFGWISFNKNKPGRKV